MRWITLVVVVISACGSNDDEAEARARRAKEEVQIEEPRGTHDPDLELSVLQQRVAKAAAEAHAKGAADYEAELVTLGEELFSLSRNRAELDKQVGLAIDAVEAAQNDADRAAAVQRIKVLQKQEYELEHRMTDIRATFERAERLRAMQVPPGYQANPNDKACI
jgi:hypothetical protein